VSVIEDRGVPWTVVSRKTGISYGRLRCLKERSAQVTFEEFRILVVYCGLEPDKYMNAIV
jgi:hypothetical protein